jgi:hypothetical protein
MKNFFKAIFVIGLVLSFMIGSPVAAVVCVLGFAYANNPTFINEYAMLNLMPAVIRDPKTGQAIPSVSRAQKTLLDFFDSPRANAVTKDALQKGAIIWNPVSYYIRANITGLSGRQKILGSATTKVLGICNIDKGILPQYYNFCYDRVTVRYVSTNTLSNATNVATLAGYSSVLSSMDDALRNGEIIVSLNRFVQIETPITDFGAPAAVVGGGARDYDGGLLESPKIWEENLQVEVELNLPQAVDATANFTNAVEVVFSGIEARLRN